MNLTNYVFPLLISLFACPLFACCAPRHELNPAVEVGGFSTTLVNGDDAVSSFIPRNCTLKNSLVGVVKITATGEATAQEVPLEAMAASAGYRFETQLYPSLRIRMKAEQKVSGHFLVAWVTEQDGLTQSGSKKIRHEAGKWVVHSIDFSNEPTWKGELKKLSFRLLTGRGNIGKPVEVDRVELVSDDQTGELFGIEYVLMNVIQRTKTTKGYRSEVEEILLKYDGLPDHADELDGRIYYFAKEPGKHRVAVNRCYNQSHKAYIDLVGAIPNGYEKDALLGYIWTKPYIGMSPVLRVVNKGRRTHALVDSSETLKGYAPDTTLGYAYARSEQPLQEYEYESDDLDDIFYIESGDVRYGVNLDHGAAGWHWVHGKKQMVNIADFGRQLQLSYYFNGLNPSGVGFGRGQVGNPVVHVHQYGNQLVTRTVPFDWNFKNLLRNEGSVAHPDLLAGFVLGTDVTFGILGHKHLAKWTAYLHTPLAIGNGKPGVGSQFEILSNHPTADFSYRANIDFDSEGKLIVTETKENEKKGSDEEMGTLYNYPSSGIGGNISALGPEDDQLAFGLLVGIYIKAAGGNPYRYRFAGEKRIGSSRHVNISTTDKIGKKHASPFDGATTAQRSVMRTATLPGDNRYVVYIMSGTIAEVKKYMQDLYDKRDYLEW